MPATLAETRDVSPAPLQTRSLKPRAVRLAVSGVIARLGDSRIGQLVNIGVGGALMRLNASATVGACEELTLLRGSYLVRVPASVVRVSHDPAPDATVDEWSIAVQFRQSPAIVRAHLTALLEHGAPGVRTMVDGGRDRRLPSRVPDPACPSCGAVKPDVQVTGRPATTVVFRCARCQHAWQVLKP